MKNYKNLKVFLLAFLLMFTSACANNKSKDSTKNKVSKSEVTQKNNLNKAKDSEKSSNTFESAKIVSVSDGDTFTIDLNGSKKKIRLILVDTPESVHPDPSRNTPYGKIASEYTKKNLQTGREVFLQRDVSNTDKYGRLLRYVWLKKPKTNNPSDEEIKKYMYNAILLENGYASLYTFPPDVKYVNLFRKLANQAREENKGLWAENGLKDRERKKSSFKQKSSDSNQKIKGSKKSMIYHLPNDKYYNKISKNNIVYFNSEEEAQAAGYRKAKK